MNNVTPAATAFLINGMINMPAIQATIAAERNLKASVRSSENSLSVDGGYLVKSLLKCSAEMLYALNW